MTKPGGGLLACTGTGAGLRPEARDPGGLSGRARSDGEHEPAGARAQRARRTAGDVAIYVYHSNPAAVAPDQNAVLRGLAREDLFTVVHERFLTDTARQADLVLPATTSLEHADLYRSLRQLLLQRVRPAIAPRRGEPSPTGRSSGRSHGHGLPGAFFRETADEAIVDALLAGRPLSGGIEPRRLEGRAVRAAVPAGPRSATPSGKIELENPSQRQPLPLPVGCPPTGTAGASPLRLMTGACALGAQLLLPGAGRPRAARRGRA